MARQPEPEEHGESAPMWIVSFADLVTLMLSFFVILASGANKGDASDPDFAALVASLKAAFHNVDPSAPPVANPKAEFAELVKKIMTLQPKTESGRRGDADGKGVYGKHFRVTRLRDGLEVSMGGPVFFEPFSIKPTAEGERQLQDLLKTIKGRRNVIEIRGHVGETPWPSDWNYDNVMKLGYDRADYVAHVFRQEGVDPRAIRLVAVGPNEPLKADRLEPVVASENRRVEIIIRESLIDDYIKETPANRGVSAGPPPPPPNPRRTSPASKWLFTMPRHSSCGTGFQPVI